LSTLALQWNSKVKYMTSMHVNLSIGATVMTKSAFAKLPIDVQKTLLADSKEFEQKLIKAIRADNEKALQALKQAGLQVVESPSELVKSFAEQALAIRDQLEPGVYSHDWRVKVEKLLAEYRGSHPSASE